MRVFERVGRREGGGCGLWMMEVGGGWGWVRMWMVRYRVGDYVGFVLFF